MIGILATGGGNIKSVSNALTFLDIEHTILSETIEAKKIDALVMPGVGHFKTAMSNLRKYGLDEQIHEFYASGKNIVGICLGFQILFDGSAEAVGESGLSLLNGHAQKFTNNHKFANMNVGWRTISCSEEGSILSSYSMMKFYFMHCFRVVEGMKNGSLATSEYAGDKFAAAVWKENLRAFQFHPEKSGIDGLNLLKAALFKQ